MGVAPGTAPSSDQSPVIETDGLTKAFGPVLAVDGLSLAVPRGSIFGFLGPNGAGKTTTIRLLLALLRPTRGRALLLGEEVVPGTTILGRVGALVERPAFYPYLSATENLLTFGAARGIPARRSAELGELALARTGLTDVARRRVGGFSTGMRQRLGIALALLDDPPLVILDEPTTGLDPQGMIDVRRLIGALAEGGTTVFLSTHLLAEAEQLCTQVAVINRGRLVTAGPTAELFAARQHVWLRFASTAERESGVTALLRQGFEVAADGEVAATLPAESDGRRAIATLGEARVYPAEVAVRRPSLEQLYIELTGAADAETAA